MRTVRCIRRIAAAALCASLFAVPGKGQAASPQDLTKTSLEDLMNISVTSVSKTEQKLSRTAAAVFVITQEDIARSGATNIPDLLRMVPGMDVAQINGNTWAISARGLNGRYSNELLVLLDGRIIYLSTFGGVYWDVFDVPLNDIERIEVIRGPGGSVWGANAVNGVVNIITKKASATAGTMMVAGGGNVDQAFGTLQYGGAAGRAGNYRVFAKYFNQDQLPGTSGPDGGDGWHLLRGGFREDSKISSKDDLTVEGDIYAGRKSQEEATLASVTSPAAQLVETRFDVSGAFVQGVWKHSFSDRSNTTLQVSYDTFDRHDLLGIGLNTLSLDFQHHLEVRQRHSVTWGLSFHDSNASSDGGLALSFQPAHIDTQLYGGFAQDEISLVRDRLYLTAGTRLEHNRFSGFNLMPSVRVAWTPSGWQTLWTAVSYAVRTPALIDTIIRVNFGSFPGPGGTPVLAALIGNPHLRDETALAYEAGYRAQLNSRLSADFDLYYTNYGDQETDEPAAEFSENTPPPSHFVLPTTYGNLMSGESHGVEIWANWKPSDRWTLSPGYAFEQVFMHTEPGSQDTTSVAQSDGSSPVHSAQLRSHLELPRHFSWDASAYFTGRIADPEVASHTRVDTALTWRGAERFSLSVVGQNLWSDRYLEYIDTTGSTSSTLMKRSVYGKLAWNF